MLCKLDNLIKTQIVKRPSQSCKSPYVADININDNNFLAHTPSLGCCGLVDKDSYVYVQQSSKENNKCTYVVYLAIQNNNIIGVHPKIAENLVESALSKNYLSKLKNIKNYKREFPVKYEHVNSRFDFYGTDEHNVNFLLEVKNVPLMKDGKAIFPEGYRKKKTDTVSPRALKHTNELTFLRKHNLCRCIICFVIQRTDINCFMPCDDFYRPSLIEAYNNGVEIITLVVSWKSNGECFFVSDSIPLV